MLELALYVGPPNGVARKIGHTAIRLWFLNQYSHSELKLGNVGYSSSARDGGVRSKEIDFYDGKWDLYSLPGADVDRALAYHQSRKGAGYDWAGVAAYPLPFMFRHSKSREFCFEHTANMLGLPQAHSCTPHRLVQHAIQLQQQHQANPKGSK